MYQICFNLKYAIHMNTYLVIHTTNFKILGSQIKCNKFDDFKE